MWLRNSDKVMILLRLLSSCEIPSRGQIYKQQTTYAGALLSTHVLPGICVSVCRIRASASLYIHGIYTAKLNLLFSCSSLSKPLSCSCESSHRNQHWIPTPHFESGANDAGPARHQRWRDCFAECFCDGDATKGSSGSGANKQALILDSAFLVIPTQMPNIWCNFVFVRLRGVKREPFVCVAGRSVRNSQTSSLRTELLLETQDPVPSWTLASRAVWLILAWSHMALGALPSVLPWHPSRTT